MKEMIINIVVIRRIFIFSVFLQSLWSHSIFNVVFQYLIMVFIILFCLDCVFLLKSFILYFFMSGPLCLCVLGFWTALSLWFFITSVIHILYRNSRDNWITFYSQRKNKKYIIYKAVSLVSGLAYKTKTTFIYYLLSSIWRDWDDFMPIFWKKKNSHTV